MAESKFFVGQEVFVTGLRITGIEKRTINKVGKKYFYIGKDKFLICNKKHITTSGIQRYYIYLQKEEYLDGVERNKLISAIYLYLRSIYYQDNKDKLPLKTLREIVSVLGIENHLLTYSNQNLCEDKNEG